MKYFLHPTPHDGGVFLLGVLSRLFDANHLIIFSFSKTFFFLRLFVEIQKVYCTYYCHYGDKRNYIYHDRKFYGFDIIDFFFSFSFFRLFLRFYATRDR